MKTWIKGQTFIDVEKTEYKDSPEECIFVHLRNSKNQRYPDTLELTGSGRDNLLVALTQSRGESLESLSDLYRVSETIRDGEAEYGCELFVHADSPSEAFDKAMEYIAYENIGDAEDEGKSYKEFLVSPDSEWAEFPGDYRLFTVQNIRHIGSLEGFLDLIREDTIKEKPQG